MTLNEIHTVHCTSHHFRSSTLSTEISDCFADPDEGKDINDVLELAVMYIN